jgi:hypothetical protein
MSKPDELTVEAVRHVPTHIAAAPSRGRAEAGRAPATLWHDLDELLEAVYSSATKLGSAIHGPEHWHSVAVAALHLLAAGEPADRPLVFVFALLHDARRLDDGADPEHGPRAAELLHRLRERGLLDMPDLRAAHLDEALRAHARGEVSKNPTIALCCAGRGARPSSATTRGLTRRPPSPKRSDRPRASRRSTRTHAKQPAVVKQHGRRRCVSALQRPTTAAL